MESPSQENVKMEPDFGNLKENPIVKHANGGLGEAKKKEEEEEKEREVPAVTEEMLQKHSYHYYLMHNFFLSESSTSVSESEESLSPATPVKIVKKVDILSFDYFELMFKKAKDLRQFLQRKLKRTLLH